VPSDSNDCHNLRRTGRLLDQKSTAGEIGLFVTWQPQRVCAVYGKACSKTLFRQAVAGWCGAVVVVRLAARYRYERAAGERATTGCIVGRRIFRQRNCSWAGVWIWFVSRLERTVPRFAAGVAVHCHFSRAGIRFCWFSFRRRRNSAHCHAVSQTACAGAPEHEAQRQRRAKLRSCGNQCHCGEF